MTGHAIFYLAAAVAAAFLIYAARVLRSAWLQARPSRGSRFAKFGEDIRLRDLFRLAVLVEEEGNAFYLRLADKVREPETKKLCLALAAEETGHRQLIQDQLDRWAPLGPHLVEWPVFLEKVKQEGLFGNPPGENAPEEEMAAFAIRQEIKTAEFYQLFETAFPEAWKRAHLHHLVLEERKHEARLRAAYPHVM